MHGLFLISSHSLGCLFTMSIVSLAGQKCFRVMQSNLSIFVIVACALRSNPLNHCLASFSSISCIISGITFKFLIHYFFFLELTCIRVQFHSICGYPVFLMFVEENLLSLLCVLGTLFKGQLTVDAWIYFWAFDSVSLICISLFMALSYGFDYGSFETQLIIRNCDVSSFVLSQDFFGTCWSFVVI